MYTVAESNKKKSAVMEFSWISTAEKERSKTHQDSKQKVPEARFLRGCFAGKCICGFLSVQWNSWNIWGLPRDDYFHFFWDCLFCIIHRYFRKRVGAVCGAWLRHRAECLHPYQRTQLETYLCFWLQHPSSAGNGSNTASLSPTWETMNGVPGF